MATDDLVVGDDASAGGDLAVTGAVAADTVTGWVAIDRAAVSEYLDRVSQARTRPGDDGAMATGDPLKGSRL